MISERRRKTREIETLDLSAETNSDLAWDRLRPVLDSAIDELSKSDREAVILRFLERRAFAEVGVALGISQDAARIRTDRALDKLRILLVRRGITSTSTALSLIVSSQAAISAPVGFAADVVAHSLAVIASTVGAGSLIFFMTTKTISIAVLSAVVAFVAGVYFGFPHKSDNSTTFAAESRRQLELVASLRRDNEAQRAEIGRLSAETARLNATRSALVAQRPASPTTPSKAAAVSMTPGQKQRKMLNYLKQIDGARAQYQLENGRPAISIKDLMGVYIRRIDPLDGEDYDNLSMLPGQPLAVTSPHGLVAIYDPSGVNTTKPNLSPEELRADELGRKLEASAAKALEAYRAANGGNNPPNPDALIPYFATPQEGADAVEYLEALKAAPSK